MAWGQKRYGLATVQERSLNEQIKGLPPPPLGLHGCIFMINALVRVFFKVLNYKQNEKIFTIRKDRETKKFYCW